MPETRTEFVERNCRYDYTLPNGTPFYGKPDEIIMGGLAIYIDARGVRHPLRPEPHMIKLIPETDRK